MSRRFVLSTFKMITAQQMVTSRHFPDEVFDDTLDKKYARWSFGSKTGAEDARCDFAGWIEEEVTEINGGVTVQTPVDSPSEVEDPSSPLVPVNNTPSPSIQQGLRQWTENQDTSSSSKNCTRPAFPETKCR